MVYSQTVLFILSNEFFNLMTVLLYLLSDTAALFLQSKTRVEPASYIVGDHSKCAYNN